jgi:ATPase subunit of ABC transporter with duplicated ATPase domains
LFDDLSFSLSRNGIVGVLGPNGVGNTTLFRILVGQDQPDAGQLRIGDTVRMSYADQNRAQVAPDRTAWEVVSEGHDFLTVGQMDVPSRAYLAAFGFKGPDRKMQSGMGERQHRLSGGVEAESGPGERDHREVTRLGRVRRRVRG